MHWSETLIEEVQGDWSLLRRALLAEYGSSKRKSSSTVPSLPSAMVPVPAAAPPPAPPLPMSSPLITTSMAIRGRIRVIAPDSTGYLSKQLNQQSDRFKWICLTTEKVYDACILSGTMGEGGIQFKFEDLNPLLSHVGERFGMIWLTTDPLSSDVQTSVAMLTAVHAPGIVAHSTTRNRFWDGPVIWITWARCLDNTLTPKLKGMPEAEVAISGPAIMLASRVDAYVKGTPWNKVRLVFEPI